MVAGTLSPGLFWELLSLELLREASLLGVLVASVLWLQPVLPFVSVLLLFSVSTALLSLAFSTLGLFCITLHLLLFWSCSGLSLYVAGNRSDPLSLGLLAGFAFSCALLSLAAPLESSLVLLSLASTLVSFSLRNEILITLPVSISKAVLFRETLLSPL